MAKATYRLPLIVLSLTLGACTQELGRQSMALPEPTCTGHAPRLSCEIPANDPSRYASYFAGTGPAFTPIAKASRIKR